MLPAGLSQQDLHAALASHFGRDDIGLSGFASFFAAQANAAGSPQDDALLTTEEVDTMLQETDSTSRTESAQEEDTKSPGVSSQDESNPVTKSPRDAFETMDVQASKAAHSREEIRLRVIASPEKHSAVGERLKSIVYGGLDGIITTFAVVAGATGGHLDTSVILILGVSNMFADAVSMGMGDAISTKAENEMIWKEREREAWEMDNYPEGEIQEMTDIYIERGLDPEQARIAVQAMSSNKEFFVDQMVTDELGMELPDEDDNPWCDGLITFSSFVFFGLFPLLAYICLNATDASQDTMFGLSCGLTAIMLFVLGIVKSQFTKQPWLYAGLEILGLGGFTAAVSYGIGALVAEIV